MPVSHKDKEVVRFIRQWVGDNVIHYINEKTTAYDLRSKLDTLYGSKTTINKVPLIN